MGYRYFIVDAFSDVVFGGVPVAVFPDADQIPPAFLRPLAEEVVADDTVFIHSIDPGRRYGFRSYNSEGACVPGAHALIAGLAALKHSAQIQQVDGSTPIKIDTVEDAIEAYIDTSAKRFPFLLKEHLLPSIDRFVPEQDELANIIQLSADDISHRHYQSMISQCGKPILVVPLKSYHAVREAEISLNQWVQSSLPTSLVDEILVFAPSTDRSGADFHARLLVKGAARGSDPAVGDALPAFAAYLNAQDHVRKGTHSITVRRGANNERQSTLHLELDKREEEGLNIRIGGAAVVSSYGEVLLEPEPT